MATSMRKREDGVDTRVFDKECLEYADKISDDEPMKKFRRLKALYESLSKENGCIMC